MKFLAACLMIFLIANAFSADGWYAWRQGYEKCRDDVQNKLWICREDYVNNFCYGKERVWRASKREQLMFDRNREWVWFDRDLIAVRNLNSKCEYHGWARFKLVDGSWKWQCYFNNREREDAACKGFTKR